MSGRADWQALQDRLTEARNSLELGDESSARRAIDAALALDGFPDEHGNEAVRDPDARYAGTENQQPSSGEAALSAEAFALFERRAFRRRLEHCAETTRAALAKRDTAAARDAIQEIRELDADHPSISTFEHELNAIESSKTKTGHPVLPVDLERPLVAVVDEMREAQVPYVSIAAEEGAPYSHLAPQPGRILPLVLILAIMALVGWGLGAMLASRSSAAGRSAAVASSPRSGNTGNSSRANLSASADEDKALSTGTSGAPNAAQPPHASSRQNAEALGAATPSTSPGSSPADDERVIRDLLERYRQAYTTLDVDAVRRVWPGGNEADLAQRFDELVSQDLIFDTCRVNVHEVTATAVCRGVVRSVPKDGLRDLHVEARGWGFALRKSGGEWQIESAREGA